MASISSSVWAFAVLAICSTISSSEKPILIRVTVLLGFDPGSDVLNGIARGGVLIITAGGVPSSGCCGVLSFGGRGGIRSVLGGLGGAFTKGTFT